MKIKVVYQDDGTGLVDASELDELIETGKIMAFERSNKLVVVGLHPTRQKKTGSFEPERRRGV